MLNGLIDISRDGMEGFKTCAEDVDDATLRMYFRTLPKVALKRSESEREVEKGRRTRYNREHSRNIAQGMGGHQGRDLEQ